MWTESYVNTYTRIIRQYSDVIAPQMFGHLHSDSYTHTHTHIPLPPLLRAYCARA